MGPCAAVQVRQRKARHLQRIMENMGQLERLQSGYRALAPHFAGGFEEDRVFGGHLLAQFYMALRLAKPSEEVQRIDVTFLAGASTQMPIDYNVIEERGPCTFMEARQNERLLDKAVARYRTEHSQLARRFAKTLPIEEFQNLPSPATCPLMESVLEEAAVDDHLRTTGPGYDFMFSKQNRELFEVRLTDPSHVRGAKPGPIRNYLRLRKELRDVAVDDPMIVPLLISDYFACLPVTVLTEKLLIPIETVASLTHKVVLHTDRCDPTGWFILELDFDACTSTGLVLGRVATEDGSPLLNFAQQFYIQFDEKSKM